jgi:hypothetical protein
MEFERVLNNPVGQVFLPVHVESLAKASWDAAMPACRRLAAPYKGKERSRLEAGATKWESPEAGPQRFGAI